MKKSIMVAALFGCAIALLGVSCANESKNDSSANVSTGKDETNKSEADKNETDKDKDESDDDKNDSDKTWKEVTKFASGDYKGTTWTGVDGEISLKYFLSFFDPGDNLKDYKKVFKDIKLPVKRTIEFFYSKVTMEYKMNLTKMAEAVAKADYKKEADVWKEKMNKWFEGQVSEDNPWFGISYSYSAYSKLNDELMKIEEEKEKYNSKRKEYEYYINSNKTQLKYVAYMPDPDLDGAYTDEVAEETILKKL